jgi:segregation and condensation protein A
MEADAEANPQAVAAWLAFRLAKLDAMRRAAESLEERPILGRDVFARGHAEAVTIVSKSRLDGDLFGLVAAYAGRIGRSRDPRYRPPIPQAYRLDEARERLKALAPGLRRWTALTGLAPTANRDGPTRASCVASTLSASLELVREGELEARQLSAFQEVYLRGRKAAA